jgi:hypothetical protein
MWRGSSVVNGSSDGARVSRAEGILGCGYVEMEGETMS